MKRFLIPALLLASFTVIPMTGCVVHERDHDRDFHAEHHDEVIREAPPRDEHHDDIRVDVHP